MSLSSTNSSTRSKKSLDSNNNNSRSRRKTITCEQTWTIENFAVLLGPLSFHLDGIESCRFDSTGAINPTEQIQFSQHLVPYYQEDNDEEKYISLYLKIHAEHFVQQRVQYKFAILGGGGKAVYVKASEAKFDQLARSLGFPKFITHEELANFSNGYLVDNKLIIRCLATYEIELPRLSSTTSSIASSVSDLHQNYKSLERKLAELRAALELEKIVPEPECTSSLDEETERKAREKALKKKRSSFFGFLAKNGKYSVSRKNSGL